MAAHAPAFFHTAQQQAATAFRGEGLSGEEMDESKEVKLHHRAAGLSNDFGALSTTSRLLSGRLQHGGRGRFELVQAELLVAAAEQALQHARALRDGLKPADEDRLDGQG